MEVIIDNHSIEVKIVRKANKNLYMRFISCDELLVTCNRLVSKEQIKKIILKNEQSLTKMYQKILKEQETQKYFWYLGKKYNYEFNEKYKDITFSSDTIYAPSEKKLTKFYKMECLRVFKSEVDRIKPYFPNIPDFELKIRNMKTRWGVNNRGSNTITLNSELLKKDISLLDYVIIHELCHFYEANHSSRFWAKVEEYYPNYKEARKKLRY